MHGIFRVSFLLLIVVQGYQAVAGTQSVTVDIGGQPVYVPAPPTFHEISQLSPETRKLAETMTLPSHRLLAVFVSESDLGRIMKVEDPECHRYMLLHVLNALENADISGAEFLQIAGQAKHEQDTLWAKVKDELGPATDDLSARISKDYGVALKLKIGDTVPLGMFMEKNDAVGFACLTKCQASAEGQQFDSLKAVGISIMRVQGKVLYAYVYSKYETPKDLDWVRATSGTWADQILAANAGQGASAKADYRSKSTPSFWGKVAEKALLYGCVGLIFGVVVLIARKIKKHNA